MKLAFTLEAQRDLIEISDFIAQRNPARAMGDIDELEFQCRRMAEHPLSYDEHRKGSGVRRMVFGRYLVFYWVNPDRVLVLRVVAAERNFDVSDL